MRSRKHYKESVCKIQKSKRRAHTFASVFLERLVSHFDTTNRAEETDKYFSAKRDFDGLTCIIRRKLTKETENMIYYIADMHFGHENVLRFDNRPFPDTAQMDDTLIQNWNGRVTSEDTVYVLGDAFWKNEENSIRIMERLRGHKHLIQGNHDRVKGKLRLYWESIEQYAEVNDENRLVILSHYPILFYKNQHYGAVMLYGHVHNTREWELVEKWKKEQWAMGIPSRLINVGCMMDYMRYTPRTLDELLDVNPMPEIARDRKDGSAVESAE